MLRKTALLWAGITVIVFAVLSFLDDTRAALISADPPVKQGIAMAASGAVSLAVVATVLRARWWAFAAVALGVAAHLAAMSDPMLGGRVKGHLLLATLIVVTAGAVRADRRTTLLSLALYVSSRTTALAFRNADAETIVFGELPVIAVVGIVGWLFGSAVRHRQAAEERAAELAAQAELARERERALLARELHDVVAHELTIIAMQASMMRFVKDPEELEAARAAIERTSRTALDELKRLLQVLRTAEVIDDDPAPGESSIGTAVAAVADHLRGLGHPVTVECAVQDLPRSVETVADRVLREAVTNVVKHSPSSSAVRIAVVADAVELRISVVNDSLDQEHARTLPSSSSGLPGLEERLSLLGGVFAAGPRADCWVVEVRIPLSPPDADLPGGESGR